MSANEATFLVAAAVAVLIVVGYMLAGMYDNRAELLRLKKRLDALEGTDDK